MKLNLHLYGWVALGGAIGTLIRALISQIVPLQHSFHIVLINILGSMLLAVLYTRFTDTMHRYYRLMLGVGLLGGFTTMSTFAVDVVVLLKSGINIIAIGYMLFSIVGSLVAATFGYWLAARRGGE